LNELIYGLAGGLIAIITVLHSTVVQRSGHSDRPTTRSGVWSMVTMATISAWRHFPYRPRCTIYNCAYTYNEHNWCRRS